jgi:hypothetical protein
MPPRTFRRIVTGHDQDGRSVISEDCPPNRVCDNLGENGLVFYEVWNTREMPARIDRAGGEPKEERLTLAPPPISRICVGIPGSKVRQRTACGACRTIGHAYRFADRLQFAFHGLKLLFLDDSRAAQPLHRRLEFLLAFQQL